MSVGLWAVGGIVTSLVVEKFIRYITGRYAHIQGYRWKSGLEDRSILKRRSKAQRNKKKGSGIQERGEWGGDITTAVTFWRCWGSWGKLS